MKLCLIAPLPPPYGGVANWERIIEEKIKEDKDVHLSIINIAANKRPMDGRSVWDRVIYCGFVMLRTYFKLLKDIQTNRPDVCHMTTSGGLGFYRDLLLLQLLRRKKIYSVYHVHFGRAVEYKQKNNRNWKNLVRAVGLADVTIAIDRKTYDILLEHANAIYEVNNPINVKRLSVFQGIKEEKAFAYVGWIIKAKGVEELIEAFKGFNKKKRSAYKLYMVGPGNKAYISSLKESGGENITFTGEVSHEDAMGILAKSEILILPSYTEGFPNVILEAMAMKKCIIATNVGAIPEMLSENAGIIIEPKSVEQIEKALEIIENSELRREIGERAYKKALQMYDIVPTYLRYKEIWNGYEIKQ